MNFSLFTNRLSIFTSILLLLFIFNDINVRLMERIQVNESNFLNKDVLDIKKPLLSLEIKKKIEQDYKKYKSIDAKSILKQQNISLEQQKLQQGRLTTVFVRDKRLKLKAVITEKSSVNYALIEVTNVKDKSTTLVKCKDKGIILDYRLEIKNNTQVYLRYLAEESVPEIILTMYKK